MGCSFVMFFVRNIWAMWEERQKYQKLERKGKNPAVPPSSPQNRMIKFVTESCKQIAAEKK